jgi:hypothetical protein
VIQLPCVAQVDDAAQEKAKELARQEDLAVELLRAMDRRIYRARDAGMNDVFFRHRFKGDGALSDVDFYVAFWWKKPFRQRLEFQDAKGKPLKSMPASLQKNPQSIKWLKSSTEALAHTRLIGLPFEKVYSDYHKSVTERIVNNEVEKRISLVPRKRKIFNKITIVVRGGLPVEIHKTSEAGREVHLFYKYEKRGKLNLCVGMTNEVAHRIMLEEAYPYVTINDVIVLKKILRMSNSGPTKKTTITLEELKVNQKLSDDVFEAK